MKIRLDYRGVCFELECSPLLVAGGLYAVLFLGITALCGVLGAAVTGILTVIISIAVGDAL